MHRMRFTSSSAIGRCPYICSTGDYRTAKRACHWNRNFQTVKKGLLIDSANILKDVIQTIEI